VVGTNGHDSQGHDNAQHSIVVMDANDSVHRLIQLLLQLNGYRVLPAENADHVLQLLRDDAVSIAVIVMDLTSDGASSVLREANESHPHVRLVVTGAPPDGHHDLVANRRSWRLRKPFTPGDLLHAVGDAVRSRLTDD
jgi:DNA-binding NtrC family response regulator